jgi:hypothetical protein
LDTVIECGYFCAISSRFELLPEVHMPRWSPIHLIREIESLLRSKCVRLPAVILTLFFRVPMVAMVQGSPFDTGYENEFEVAVFFARDSAVLDEKAKKDLDNLADIAKSLDGYLVEVAGYTSNTLSKEADQRVVVQYDFHSLLPTQKFSPIAAEVTINCLLRYDRESQRQNGFS